MKVKVHNLKELLTIAEQHNIRILFVPSSEVHDFAAMNWVTAERFGIPDFPKNTIKVDERFKEHSETLSETEFRNLKHEFDEAADEQRHNGPYWPSHLKAQRMEHTSTVEIPKTDTPNKLQPKSHEAQHLLVIGKFPKRDTAMHRLGHPNIEEVHDDGDLTVRKGNQVFVVTTEGQIFQETKGRKLPPTTNLRISPKTPKLR